MIRCLMTRVNYSIRGVTGGYSGQLQSSPSTRGESGFVYEFTCIKLTRDYGVNDNLRLIVLTNYSLLTGGREGVAQWEEEPHTWM